MVDKKKNMPYVYPKLREAQARARELGLPTPHSSQKRGKKLYVVYEGVEIHFGARGYEDYLIHKDEKRRENYRARHGAIKLANGRFAYRDPRQPAYYSWHILW